MYLREIDKMMVHIPTLLILTLVDGDQVYNNLSLHFVTQLSLFRALVTGSSG